MKKTDKDVFLSFLKQYKIEFKTYEDPRFIIEDAKNAVFAISVRDVLDFNFDKTGKFIGSNTDSFGSFKK